MIPFVKSNPTKQMQWRLHAMRLTSGKIWNSIVLWMNYAISLKPWTVSLASTWNTRRLWRIISLASLIKPILALILTLTAPHVVTAARNGLILHPLTGMLTVFERCPLMPLLATTRSGAKERSITSVRQRLKKSTEKQRSLFLYFLRMK